MGMDTSPYMCTKIVSLYPAVNVCMSLFLSIFCWRDLDAESKLNLLRRNIEVQLFAPWSTIDDLCLVPGA